MAENDLPLPDAPTAPEPAPAPAPAPAIAEPSRLDTIRAAVEAQKEKAPADPAAPRAAAPAGDRPRAPDGKFAPATDRPAPDRTPAAPVVAKPDAAPTPDAPAADAAPVVRPPPGWSPASKVAFDNLPESVKADIAKREQEVNQGFAKLAEYKPVEKYVEMAKRGGTTLDKALEAYTGIETLLRRDVFAGVEQVLRNVGVSPQAFFQAYAARAGGGAQTAQPQPAPQAHQAAPIDPQAIVRQATEAVRAEYETRQVQTEIQRFASDPKNRFYDNVKPMMAQLVQSGLATTIQDAYDKACRMDPQISALLNQPAAADPRIAAANAARAAARATTGAPSPGAVMNGRAPDGNQTTRATIEAAVAAQRARA